MCGQSYIHTYAVEMLNKLRDVAVAVSDTEDPSSEGKQRDRLVEFYHELMKSTDNGEKPHICAKYWTKGRLRKVGGVIRLVLGFVLK